MNRDLHITNQSGGHRSLRYVVFIALFFVAPSLLAQFFGENLIYTLPASYVLAFTTNREHMHMQEFVPTGQSIQTWTELITTQTFSGKKNTNLSGYWSVMKQQWMAACTTGQVTPPGMSVENGAHIAFFVMTCPLNPATEKPEITYFKAIQGNDSFYVVQKSFRFLPSKEQMGFWVNNLRAATVCDTRSRASVCPHLSNSSSN